jgi:hypothetical protein
MPRLVQGDGCINGDLFIRSPTCLAARQFTAKAGVIKLDLSSQQLGAIK